MNKELQEYYEKLIDMFSHDGWKYMMEDINKLVEEGVNNWNNITDANQFFVHKGNLQTLKWIQNFELITRNNFEALSEEDTDANV